MICFGYSLLTVEPLHVTKLTYECYPAKFKVSDSLPSTELRNYSRASSNQTTVQVCLAIMPLRPPMLVYCACSLRPITPPRKFSYPPQLLHMRGPLTHYSTENSLVSAQLGPSNKEKKQKQSKPSILTPPQLPRLPHASYPISYSNPNFPFKSICNSPQGLQLYALMLVI